MKSRRAFVICILSTLIWAHGFTPCTRISTAQDQSTSVSRLSDPKFESLRRSIVQLAERHQGDVSIAIEFVGSSRKISLNENRVMPTASLIKVAVMVEAYRQIENGKLALDQRIELKQNDKVPGSGVLTSHFDAGLKLTLKDAIRLMIVYSDNTATNLVIDQVGLANVCSTMKKMGWPNTQVNSKVYRGSTTSISKDRSQKYGLGNTTATETLQLLKQLYQGKLVSKKASAAMLDHLRRCDDNSKLAKFLPIGTKIANKTGAISHARCDAAVIETKSGPVVCVVLTRNNQDKSWTDNNAANLLCATIGKRVFDFANSAASGTQPTAPVVLSEGSVGTQVEHLQRTLNVRVKPSPNLAVDGDFGPATRTAVIQFQRQSQVEPTGIIDADDWKLLSPVLMSDRPAPDPAKINSEKLTRKQVEPLQGRPFVTAKSWAIADLESGKILFEQDKSKVLDIASTTKIMTAFLVLELAEKNPAVLEEKITFSERADKTRGSTSGIRAGEIISVRELLYGLMLPSGNDASVALAEHFGSRLVDQDDQTAPKLDGYDAFILAMNQKAKSLGMNRSAFRNPHGLTAQGHQATAEDLVKLAVAAMKLDSFRSYVSTRQHGCRVDSVSGYQRNVVWKNTNQLLAIDKFIGVKTGTTTAAGACLVSASNRGDRELLMVILGSGSSRGRYADSRNLYRWAWNQLGARN